MQGVLRASVLAFALLPAFGAAASADVGCGGEGKPPCTILRPEPTGSHRAVDPTAPECVVYVGGIASPTVAHPVGSQTTDSFFDPLIDAVSFTRDGRAVIPYRFGYERAAAYPYATEGAIDPNARSLRRLVRDLSDECFAIDIVAHSMGGAVADRALSLGLTDRDGLAMYLPLASPHNGALAAHALRLGVEIDRTYAEVVGPALASTPLLHDPRSDAVRDLKDMTRPVRLPRVPAVRQRMANDLVVLRRDNADRRYDVREYLPGLNELEGHGAIVTNEHVLSVVTTAIRTHEILSDDRSLLEVKAASATSRLVGRYAGGVMSSAGLAGGAVSAVIGLSSVAAGNEDLGTLVTNVATGLPEIMSLAQKASELKGDPRAAVLQAIVESALDVE